MMTLEMITAQLDAVSADVSYHVADDGYIWVTVEDFAGFDEDWSEIDRELEDAEAVDALIEWLEAHADSREGDFYYEYHFDAITVCLGWASYEI